ncbi:MAG: hypothetical protein LKJ17_05620 [Oscillospiraceae bacterium]|jgi:hypothetical protein|nr:hypothetical protein [Oscillospiraceae bacterium]
MAREGLLIHESEDRPEPPAPAPETPKKKWENFWYYHKWHMLIVLLAAGLLAFVLHDLMRPEADYEIGLITTATYPQEAVELLEQSIGEYGEDLNGDGRVLVQIDSFTLDPEDSVSEMQVANQVKLDADLSSGGCLLFLTDEKSFLHQQEQNRLFAKTDGSTPAKGENDPEQMRIPLSGLKALSKLSYPMQDGQDLMDRLGLSLRIYQGSAAEGTKDAEWEASRRLFEKLAG